MRRDLLLLLVLGAMVVIAQAVFAEPKPHRMPISSVAPEVCEANGPIVRVELTSAKMFNVYCKSGPVQLVAP